VGKLGRFSLVVAFVAAVFASGESCLDATEIEVQLSTDVDPLTVSAHGALVRVGTPDTVDTSPTTSFVTTTCSPTGDMGDFVVVPSGSLDDQVAIDIELGVDVTTDQCDPAPNAGCIYARRQLSFAHHARLRLPIALDKSCLGVTCDPGFTCNNGSCEGSVITPTDCDGGTCTPTNDGGSVDAQPKDVGAPDALCPNTQTVCNGKCTDTLSDPSNCGACGLDCSGGTCSGGTCTLATNTAGFLQTNCLTVSGSNVYVTTETNVISVPTVGGTLSKKTTLGASSIASTSLHVVAFEPSLPQIVDLVTADAYGQTAGTTATFIATSDTGFAWVDWAGGTICYEKHGSSGAGTLLYTYGSKLTSGGYVAIAQAIVYASMVDTSQVCKMSVVGGVNCVNAKPGPIVVSDVNSTSPTVYDVESASTIHKRDSTLQGDSIYASGQNVLGAIAWDGSQIFAHATSATATTEIDHTSGTSLAKVVDTTAPVLKCIAVDGDAVYWLETSGAIKKHAK
jgi:hypothetical protein